MLIRMPGVQKPHCRACASRNAACSGCSSVPPGGRQALDRRHRGAVDLDGEHQARAHRLTVHQHGAGAADAVLAADVRAGEAELVAQEVAEEQARLDVGGVGRAIDGHADAETFRHGVTRPERGSNVKANERQPLAAVERRAR